MTVRFDGRVAIVTGAGAGLGREHALGLAARGARVVVNDFGGGVDGTGGSSGPAEETVALIKATGGEAMAHGADVTNQAQVADMVAATMDRWGRIDILVNNAGILRDRAFHKLEPSDWNAVIAVHLTGSYMVTAAVWPHMRAANYGRIVMTSSSSGLYGNFGQANYGAAKMGVVGLMNVLNIEGAKHDIRTNVLGPGAATRMTESLLPPAVAGLMTARSVTPGLLYLVSEDAPARTILNATAGGFSRTVILETDGIHLPDDSNTPEAIAARFAEIADMAGAAEYSQGGEQVMKFVGKAAASAGLSLG